MLLLALVSTSEPRKIKKQHPVAVVTVTKAKFTVFDSRGLHRVWMLIGIVTDLNCGSEMTRMKEAAAFGWIPVVAAELSPCLGTEELQ